MNVFKTLIYPLIVFMVVGSALEASSRKADDVLGHPPDSISQRNPVYSPGEFGPNDIVIRFIEGANPMKSPTFSMEVDDSRLVGVARIIHVGQAISIVSGVAIDFAKVNILEFTDHNTGVLSIGAGSFFKIPKGLDTECFVLKDVTGYVDFSERYASMYLPYVEATSWEIYGDSTGIKKDAITKFIVTGEITPAARFYYSGLLQRE
jgi:hypothetical protein